MTYYNQESVIMIYKEYVQSELNLLDDSMKFDDYFEVGVVNGRNNVILLEGVNLPPSFSQKINEILEWLYHEDTSLELIGDLNRKHYLLYHQKEE